MQLDAFDYDLPGELIAQEPLEHRPASRLMVVDRATGNWQHVLFADLLRFLDAGDVLVINRSRVLPARLFLQRRSAGRAELLVVRITDERRFLAIGNPLRKLKPGDVLSDPRGEFACRIVERTDGRHVMVELVGGGRIVDVLERFGHMPLPPYIQRDDTERDRERYQTVFARESGSVAAPTAGLHFDQDLLGALRDRGVEVLSIVLHVGLGTFLPLEHPVVEENRLHEESFSVDQDTAERLVAAKRAGRRITAVGTTTTRVLETLAAGGQWLGPSTKEPIVGETNLFIYPGFEFKFVDQLITNFHLPRSSLLVLVAAFLGLDRTLSCYAEAVASKYRFYSYGDAMLIR